MDILLQPKWMVILLVALGVLGAFAWQRWRERNWIAQRFGWESVVTCSFGVRYFGTAREPGGPRRLNGVLLLTVDRIFFRNHRTGLELDVPGSRIIRIYHGVRHKEVDLNQSVVKIDFLNYRDEEDTAAFKVPYPPQWIKAVAVAFSLNKVDPRPGDSEP